jgi:hypothetical protein
MAWWVGGTKGSRLGKEVFPLYVVDFAPHMGGWFPPVNATSGLS